MMRLGVHPQLTRLLDYFESSEYYYMILELETGGSLLQCLAERNNFIEESRCK
jgi:serine/threonine protein kinase